MTLAKDTKVINAIKKEPNENLGQRRVENH
jgi:hypothetical protein